MASKFGHRFAFDEGFLQALGLIPSEARILDAEIVELPRSKKRILIIETDKGIRFPPEVPPE